MKNILVANAGSSSVKFQVFAANGGGKLARKIKGQMEGIGTRPRLRASRPDGETLVDREYDTVAVPADHTTLACRVSPEPVKRARSLRIGSGEVGGH